MNTDYRQDTGFAWADDALGRHDATTLAQMVRTGERSPRQLVVAAIDRANAVGPKLNAIATADFERALDACDRPIDGPFAGVPIFIKDNINVEGLPTAMGSAAVSPRPASHSDAIVWLLQSLGFICLGKSSMSEFGFSPSDESRDRAATGNPHNLLHSSGASSSGSAALVASGIVPIAHGNDGGGSIRIPAACCGLVGLKPTRGLLPEPPAVNHLPVSIICQGVLTRSVRDTINFYAATAGLDKRISWTPPDVSGPRKYRVGVLRHSNNGAVTDDATLSALDRVAGELSRLGHRVRPVEVPVRSQFGRDFTLYWMFLAWLITHLGRPLFGAGFDAKRAGQLTRGLSRDFNRRFYRLPGAIRRLRGVGADYPARLRAMEVDVILSPVTTTTAPRLGELSDRVPYEELLERLRSYVGFTPLANVAGAPAISVPAGTNDRGIPIGVQLACPPGGDSNLLELALQLERAQPIGGVSQTAAR